MYALFEIIKRRGNQLGVKVGLGPVFATREQREDPLTLPFGSGLTPH